MSNEEIDTYPYAGETCSRSYDGGCAGDLFPRISRSGLTRSIICERHADILDRDLDAIERRYPEVNHSDYCTCYGCSEGSY